MAIVAALLYLHSNAFRQSIERRAESWLSDQLGREVHLRLERLGPLTLTAEVAELAIAGREPGASFVTLDRGTVDLDVWPLLRGRVAVSDMALDGLSLDLAEAPASEPASSSPETPLPSLAEILDQVSIERGRLTRGRLRMGDASWPVAVDGRGIEWTLERQAATPRYHLRLDVREGSARLSGGEWFAVAATAEADLDPAGLRVGDLRLTAPGAEIHGRATLDDLPSLTGSLAANGTFRLDDLPWPEQIAPVARGTGTLETQVEAHFAGAEIALEAHLTSRSLVVGGVTADDVDVTLSGANGAWTSNFDANLAGANVRGNLAGKLTPELVPLEAEASWSVADVSTLVAAFSDEQAPPVPLRGRLEGSLTARADSLQLDGIQGRFTMKGEGLGIKGSPGVAIVSRVDGSLAGGNLELDRIDAQGAGMLLAGKGRADLTSRSELELVLKRDESAGDAVRGLLTILGALGVEPEMPPGATRLTGEFDLTARLRGPGLEQIALDNIAGQLTLKTRGLTAAGPDGFPIDANVELGLERSRLNVRTAELSGPEARLALSGALDMDTVDATVTFEAEPSAGSRLLVEAEALGLDVSRANAVVERLGRAEFEARLTGPWLTLDGTAQLLLDVNGATPDSAARTLTTEVRLERGALDATLRLDGGPSLLTAEVHADRYDRWPPPGSARFDWVETSPGFWAGDNELIRSMTGSIAASGTVDLATLSAQAALTIADGSLGGRPFELGDAGLTIDGTRIEIVGARLTMLGGEAQIDGSLGGTGAGLRVRAESLGLANLLLAAGIEQAVGGSVTLDATFTGTLEDPILQAIVETRGLAYEEQPLTDLTGDLTFRGGVLEFDLSGAAGTTARLAGRVGTGDPLSWSLTADYPLRLDLNRWTAATSANESGPLDLTARIVAELNGGDDPAQVSGRLEFNETRLIVGGDTFVPREAPVVVLGDGVARLEKFRIDVGRAALDVGGELSLTPAAELSASIDGELPLRSLSSQIPGARLDGMAELALRIGGTATLPVWNGELRLKEGRLDHRDLPAPLERVDAVLKLAPDGWTIDPLTLNIGGGRVTGSGTYRPATAERPGDLQLQLSGQDVRMPAVQGLRSQFDADFRLSGAPAGTLTLAGQLVFDRAVYSTDIDLQRELLAKARIVDSIEELGGVLDRVRLDLSLEAPGTLFVRNNLASLQTTTSLRLAGTAADPLVTGRVEIHEGGRVEFRDVTYNVARGTLDYTADPPDNPRLDIEGRTSVGNYDIGLLVSGKLEDPQIDLTSSPPLSQADIVSLLVTGKTREDLASSGAGISEAQAALYLGQGITREIERTLARSLGLDQVTLDPTLVAAEDDPAARLTVGKALTGRLFASYSREFGGTQGDIYQMRFTPFERLSLQGQHDDQGEFLADAVYERKFYAGPKRAAAPESADNPGGRISRIAFEGNRSLKEKRLAKAFGLRLRDRFRKSALLDGLDAVGDLYLENGFPEATFDAHVDEKAGDVTVVVTVQEGRKIVIVADGPMRDKLKQSLLELWQQSVFRDEIADDAQRNALELLAGSGYVNATVETRLASPSPDTVELRLTVNAGKRVRIDRIVIEGNQAIDDGTIRQQFLSLGDNLLQRDWLRPALLAEDREAVRSLYFGRGYLDAKVAPPQVSYPGKPGHAQVDIKIEEGARYDLGEVSFSGNAAYDAEQLARVAALTPLPSSTSSTEGRPYIDAEVRQARGRLRSFYDENGYPGTQINVTRKPDREAARADVLFTVEETPHAVVESIDIDNPGKTRTYVVEDQLKFAPGDPLSADKLAQTRQELYRTGLFRSVTLVEHPGETEEGRRIELKLDERTNVRTQAGVGYGTDQGVRGSLALSHSNLGGERLYGSAGVRASQTDWRVYGLLRQPDLFHTKLQGLASSSIEQEQNESFDVRRKSTSVQIEPGRTERTFRWFVGYGVQEADIFRDGVEVDPGSGQVDLGELLDLRSDSPLLLADLNAGLTVGKRDDFAWPTTGNLLNAKFSLFDSHWLSEAEFARGVAQWSYYRPLGSGKIWSSGVRLGLAEPYGAQTAIPLSERFFAGGDNSIRGFRRDAIVPVGFPEQQFTDAGIALTGSLGGEASLIFNQELIVPFFNPVALVAFYDAGNLYWRRTDLDPGDLRHSAGLGLRVRTPVGPIRLEYGWKLDRQGDEGSGRLHFSIGVPF